MTSYWIGLMAGMISGCSGLVVLMGSPLAATPAFLFLLIFIGGMDLPLVLAGGREKWREKIARASHPWPVMFGAGFCVFAIPFAVVCLIAQVAPGLHGLIAAWLVLTLGALLCSWGFLFLLAGRIGRK